MDLIKQVCSAEQSKRLKELGIKQTSFLFWAEIYTYDANGDVSGRHISLMRPNTGEYDYQSVTPIPDNCLDGDEEFDWDKNYCAYTVAELGVMLPPNKCATVHLEEFGRHSHTCTWWNESKNIGDWTATKGTMQSIEETEASTRAEILIYLLENNHTTPEEVNTRLNNI